MDLKICTKLPFNANRVSQFQFALSHDIQISEQNQYYVELFQNNNARKNDKSEMQSFLKVWQHDLILLIRNQNTWRKLDLSRFSVSTVHGIER